MTGLSWFQNHCTRLNLSQGRRGLMVMALDCGAGGHEFKPRHFRNIFDLLERFDKTVRQRRRETVLRNGLTSGMTGVPRTRASRFMTSEVDGDGDVWTKIYGDASTKKEVRIGSS